MTRVVAITVTLCCAFLGTVGRLARRSGLGVQMPAATTSGKTYP